MTSIKLQGKFQYLFKDSEEEKGPKKKKARIVESDSEEEGGGASQEGGGDHSEGSNKGSDMEDDWHFKWPRLMVVYVSYFCK